MGRLGDQIGVIRQIPRIQTITWLAFVAGFAVVYFPVLALLVSAWYGSDDFSYGFAIIPIFLYMVWNERNRLAAITPAGSWVGLPVVVGSIAAHLFAQIGEILTLSSVSMVIFIWGCVIFLFGFGVFRACLYPLTFLFLMIPVPSQMYASLTLPLQLLVTRATVVLTSLVGIPVFREGNVINLTERTLQVVQACSGLRSIMTMLTLGAVIGFFTLRSPCTRWGLLLAGIPIAIVINILRLFIMVIVFQFIGIDLTEGPLHTLLGLSVFMVALSFFILVQRGLARCEKYL
jgi:exosortase